MNSSVTDNLSPIDFKNRWARNSDKARDELSSAILSARDKFGDKYAPQVVDDLRYVYSRNSKTLEKVWDKARKAGHTNYLTEPSIVAARSKCDQAFTMYQAACEHLKTAQAASRAKRAAVQKQVKTLGTKLPASVSEDNYRVVLAGIQSFRPTLVKQFHEYLVYMEKRRIEQSAKEGYAAQSRSPASLQSMAEAMARDSLCSFAAKLSLKIEEQKTNPLADVESVKLDAHTNPNADSHLHVKLDSGEVQHWITQTIVNFSKYGKPFNQWPTRQA